MVLAAASWARGQRNVRLRTPGPMWHGFQKSHVFSNFNNTTGAEFSQDEGPPAISLGKRVAPRPHVAKQEGSDLAHLDFLAAFRDPVAAMVPVDMLKRFVA
jgi:hypothetical protein